MTQSESELIKIRCKCGARLDMPLKAAGRRAKCPKCSHIFVIPKPPPPEPDYAEDGGMGSLLDELADEAKSAPAVSQSPAHDEESTCPKCNATLPAMSVLCVQCGYDTRHAKMHRGASRAASIASKFAMAGGTFLFGCLLSGVGALIGALVWFGIAVGASFEIGWIAWGVGALAGFGMLKGYGTPNARAGVVAAGMALAGVLCAKLMIFLFIINAVMTGNTSDINFQREYVKGVMVEELLDEQGVSSQQERDEKWDATYESADAIVSNYTDDETHDAWRKYREAEAEAVLDFKRERLAEHYATLVAQNQGLSYGDEQRDLLYKKEGARFQPMDEAQLDAELAELDAWDRGAKWRDNGYVRHALIHDRLDETFRLLGGNSNDELSPEQWRIIYTATADEVDALSEPERLEELQSVEREKDEARQAIIERIQQNESGSDLSPEEAGGLLAMFVQMMFSPLDALFVLLALSSAYKIGSGGSDE